MDYLYKHVEDKNCTDCVARKIEKEKQMTITVQRLKEIGLPIEMATEPPPRYQARTNGCAL